MKSRVPPSGNSHSRETANCSIRANAATSSTRYGLLAPSLAPSRAAALYSPIRSMTPGVSRTTSDGRNGWKNSCRPGASRSQSTVSTRLPPDARIQATFASAMVRPVPPLKE